MCAARFFSPGHSQAQRPRGQHVIATMPAMNDVVGARQHIGFEPEPQAPNAIGIAQRQGASTRDHRVGRIEVSIRCFLPETAIRPWRRLRVRPDPLDAHARGVRPSKPASVRPARSISNRSRAGEFSQTTVRRFSRSVSLPKLRVFQKTRRTRSRLR